MNLKDWLMDVNFGTAVAHEFTKEFTKEDVRMHAGFTGKLLEVPFLFAASKER